jgi:O-antigen/teichoic acid export membrane protein
MSRGFLVGGLFMVGGTAVQAVVGLGANLLLARLLGPDAFGRFAVIMASTGLILSMLALRINVLILRAPGSDLGAERRDLYLSALAIETAVAMMLALASLLWSGGLDVWSAALVTSQCALHWIGVNRACFERNLPYKRLAVIETGATTFGQIAAVALALWGMGGVVLYLRELVVAAALAACLYAVGGLTFHRFRLPGWAEWAAILREARAGWLDGILEGGFQRLIVLLAAAYGNAQSVGCFFVAQSLAMRPNQFITPAVSRVAANWYRAKEDPIAQVRARKRLLYATAAGLIPLALGTALLADTIVPFVLGEKWRDAAPILQALCGVIAFQALFEVLRAYALTRSFGRHLIISRLVQFGALGVWLVIVGTAREITMSILGVAASIAFAAAFLSLLVLVRRVEGAALHRLGPVAAPHA